MQWAHPRLDRQCLVIPLAFQNANMGAAISPSVCLDVAVSSPNEPAKARTASVRIRTKKDMRKITGYAVQCCRSRQTLHLIKNSALIISKSNCV